MIDTLVERTYVEFGGKLWRQTVGIPMGTNCAGFIANLYCFTYEFAFLKRLVNHEDWDTAARFLNAARYIDDLLVIGIPDFEKWMYQSPECPEGIYPKDILTLTLADTGARVPYMDLVIRQNVRFGIVTSIYDKRLDAKYNGH